MATASLRSPETKEISSQNPSCDLRIGMISLCSVRENVTELPGRSLTQTFLANMYSSKTIKTINGIPGDPNYEDNRGTPGGRISANELYSRRWCVSTKITRSLTAQLLAPAPR